MIITSDKPYTKKEIKKVGNTKLLIGSLSNDLYRVAIMAQRGSIANALRFHQEAKRWLKPLASQPLKPYIKKIINKIKISPADRIKDDAEDYLMYSILLQNYALHFC